MRMDILEKAKDIRNRIGSGVLNVVFPIICFGCGKEGTYICEKCEGFMGEAAFVCPACQSASFTGERHQHCKTRDGLDGLVGIWEYEGLVKKFISQIKYQSVTHAIGEIMAMAFGVMAQNTQRATPFLSFLLSEDTCITYVPMAKQKEKKRGFNQAACLAREIGNITKKKVLPLLQKIKDTPSQTELDKEQRLENVKDSFCYHADGRRSIADDRGYSISGNQQTSAEIHVPQNVVLVDDIWTTGATLKECCKVLKKAGVEKVWGFTLARTV